NSEFAQSKTASLKIGLNNPDLGFSGESFTVSGLADLDGQIEITLPDGFLPASFQQFVLMRYQTRNGSFNPVVMPALPTGQLWNFNYGNDALILRVTDSFVEPALTGFRLLSNHELHLFVTGSIGGGFSVQSSTNLVQWTGIRTNVPFSGFMEFVETNISLVP